ncbi:MAG: hypothetical protein U0Y68_08290 [Blastocatellia bacterium]
MKAKRKAGSCGGRPLEVQVRLRHPYGVQTQQALENFRISNLRLPPALAAYAEIKRAAAEAEIAQQAQSPEQADAIIRATG